MSPAYMNAREHLVMLGVSGAYAVTGTEAVLDEFLGDMTLQEYVEMRTDDATELRENLRSYNPAYWASIALELRDEVRGVWCCCGPKERALVRSLHLQAKDMVDWPLLRIWGEPTRAGFLTLRLAHEQYIGSIDPVVVRDDFNRRIGAKVRQHVFEADAYRCVRCGTAYGLAVDHIIPIHHGGLNYGLNFQTLCGRCNNWKGKRTWWPAMETGSTTSPKEMK